MIKIFLLGVMAVCTPSLLILAWAIRRAPLIDEDAPDSYRQEKDQRWFAQ